MAEPPQVVPSAERFLERAFAGRLVGSLREADRREVFGEVARA